MCLSSLTRNVSRLWNPVINKYTVLIFRYILAGIFFLSSAGKLVDIQQYSVAPVIDFEILPENIAYIFGMILPFIELLCAFGLALGILTRLSAAGIAFMSLSFFVVKTILLMNGSDISCGCFGAITTTLISETIYMDPPIMIMALVITTSPTAKRHWFSLGTALLPTWADKLRLLW